VAVTLTSGTGFFDAGTALASATLRVRNAGGDTDERTITIADASGARPGRRVARRRC
jgi:hypothetical protein